MVIFTPKYDTVEGQCSLYNTGSEVLIVARNKYRSHYIEVMMNRLFVLLRRKEKKRMK